jgi:outer membrane protein OmpA-like peptidoglycan-associated protein
MMAAVAWCNQIIPTQLQKMKTFISTPYGGCAPARATGMLLAALFMWLAPVKIQAVDYEPLRKVSDVVRVQPRAWQGNGSRLKVPMIAWGGDIQTILANGNSKSTASGSLFDKAGLQVELFREDRFLKQLEMYLTGETPFLRGTLGMMNLAAEVTNRNPDTTMVLIYQLTWSAGSDAIVVRDGIRTPADLKGKTVVLQSFGPHVDYLATILKSAGLDPRDITWKWVPDLFEVAADSVSPAMAMLEDSSVDAAMVIMPDAQILTSGGRVGTGAEGSVRGAHILLSTKTADRVIADVYAVRMDFLHKYPAVVEKFVKALVDAEAEMRRLARSDAGGWRQLLSASAGLLLDDSNATGDMEQMFREADFAGIPGNVLFFKDQNHPRRAWKIMAEIQESMTSIGLMSGKVNIGLPPFDFQKLAGAASVPVAASETPRFDTNAVSRLISRRQSQDTLGEGELFSFEIYFKPNQQTFPADLYKGEFDRAIELISTYGGALLTVEGHSDPIGYLKKKKDGEPGLVLERYKQSALNLSISRANAVRESLIEYAGTQGMDMDPSQFAVIGHGVMKPNTPNVTYDPDGDLGLQSAPRTKEEWDATRRVVFRIIQVEAEEEAFTPLF